MESTYEAKLTAEIRRTLRNLGEACREQGLTIEEALELWYSATRNEEMQEEAKEVLSYREKAEKFVRKYVSGIEKDICVEVLCFLSEKEECPSSNEIVDAISSKVLVIRSKKYRNTYVRDIVWEFLKDVEGKRCQVRVRRHWGNVRKRVFILAKAL